MDPVPAGMAFRLSALSGIRVILFDVYGTLLISASGDIHASVSVDTNAAFSDAARAVGLFPRARLGDHLKSSIRREHLIARTLGVEHPEVDIEKVWRSLAPILFQELPTDDALRALAIEYECRVNPVWPMPGFPELLDRLVERYELGVVSNAQFYTPLVLEALTGRSMTDLSLPETRCVWSYREGVAKPSPRLLGRLIERIGVEPQSVLVVGNDWSKDVAPARALGCRTALFAGDRRSLRCDEEVLSDPARRPDVVLSQLRELVGIFGLSPVAPG